MMKEGRKEYVKGNGEGRSNNRRRKWKNNTKMKLMKPTGKQGKKKRGKRSEGVNNGGKVGIIMMQEGKTTPKRKERGKGRNRTS